MKITYRVPTRQYAYMEVETDCFDTLSDEEVVRRYFALEDEYNKQKAEMDKQIAEKVPFETKDVKCGIGKSRNEYLKEIKDKKDDKV